MNELLWQGSLRRKWLRHSTVLLATAAMAVGMPAGAAGDASASAAPAPVARPLVLVVGDSLSAEYGLRRGSGWVALLGERMKAENVAGSIVNASISGDTTSGGRSRLPALLAQHRPQVMVLELGGNDALRGLPLAMTKANLAEMGRAAKAAGAKVLVVGMQVPPNYGRQYSDDFAALFADVARELGAALVPFLLTGVADSPQAEALFQPDRIHPREAAHPVMLANVWPVLKPLLTRR